MVVQAGHILCFRDLVRINREHDPNMRLLRLYRFTGDLRYREELVRVNYKLIQSQARKFFLGCKKGDGHLLDDLIQEASIGFLEGLDKFDYSKARGKLSTYCVEWIRKRILLFLEDSVDTVRYTWRVRRAAKKYKDRLFQESTEYGSLKIPFDVIMADATHSVRTSVYDIVLNEQQTTGLDGIEVEDHGVDESKVEELIRQCELLEDYEKKFALAIWGTDNDWKDKVKWNETTKRKLDDILCRLRNWHEGIEKAAYDNKKPKTLELQISNLTNKMGKGQMPTDGDIEELAEAIYEREKDPAKRIDAEKAAEMRGIEMGMKLFRGMLQSAKSELF